MIHIGQRLNQKISFLIFLTSPFRIGRLNHLAAQLRPLDLGLRPVPLTLLKDGVNDPETNIMTRIVVFNAGITQAYNCLQDSLTSHCINGF